MWVAPNLCFALVLAHKSTPLSLQAALCSRARSGVGRPKLRQGAPHTLARNGPASPSRETWFSWVARPARPERVVTVGSNALRERGLLHHPSVTKGGGRKEPRCKSEHRAQHLYNLTGPLRDALIMGITYQ